MKAKSWPVHTPQHLPRLDCSQGQPVAKQAQAGMSMGEVAERVRDSERPVPFSCPLTGPPSRSFQQVLGQLTVWLKNSVKVVTHCCDIWHSFFLLRAPERDAPLRLEHTEREYVTARKETQVGVMDPGAWTCTVARGGRLPAVLCGVPVNSFSNESNQYT